jgi:8-oxo-dGTP pyrophosphatase MutT (NUDIX family)
LKINQRGIQPGFGLSGLVANMPLAHFLMQHPPQVRETAVWNNGAMPLEINYMITSQFPPLEYVSSVRCIVFRQNELLVIHDPNGSKYVVPGGRSEPGESVEETGRREVLEETGWKLGEMTMVGVVHFHHLAPCPPNHPYPCPDFLQLIYRAEAQSFYADLVQTDEYVNGSKFYAISDVVRLGLPQGQLLLLNAAINGRTSL